MSNKSMQFLFGDRELIISVQDLLEAPVDVIVNPANIDLNHKGGVAAQIVDRAGVKLTHESEVLINQYNKIDPGMVVYTTAGELKHKAVIHAVGPRAGEGNEQQKLEQVVVRCLKLCEINDWDSIAFPAIGLGSAGLPVELCAQGFFRSITHFWDARHECNIDKIEICLTKRNFRPFFDAFREDAIVTEDIDHVAQADTSEDNISYIELSESDIADSNSNEIDEWFIDSSVNNKKHKD